MSTDRGAALKQHFTDAEPIKHLMGYLLGNVDGCTVLEPSVGHGSFLSALLGTPQRVDAVDVDDAAITIARTKFDKPYIHFHTGDFIDMFVSRVSGNACGVTSRVYDTVISNPPYGLYLDLEYRKAIKRTFPRLYSRESFGLFFAFATSLLANDGRYVFLLPDTLLASVNHRPLRELMCSRAAPTHIIRFPSKLFESVKFGYGNLCIIAGNNKKLTREDTVNWLDVFDRSPLSRELLRSTRPLPGSIFIDNAQVGWSASMFDARQESHAGWPSLHELAECRTGIYTGNNETFLGFDSGRAHRRSNGHPIDWVRQVFTEPLSAEQMRLGINGERCYVPFIRGGHKGPFDKPTWAIRWDADALAYYKNDKKARFQNTAFYFREGLAVPMVTTKRISASLMNSSVFDQGVVGVFPYDSALIPALLLYLNSQHASEMVKRLTNGSANNSANYLKRLRVPPFNRKDIQRAAKLVKNAQYSRVFPLNACDVFTNDVITTLPA